MPFLCDTNIWLELLLDQERAAEVRTFFSAVPAAELAISEFSIYSLGILLTGIKDRPQVFSEFVQTVIIEGGLQQLRLEPVQLLQVQEAHRQYKLDFDDGYQYVAAKSAGYKLVSFDAHFDVTPEKRLAPLAAISEYQSVPGRNRRT